MDGSETQAVIGLTTARTGGYRARALDGVKVTAADTVEGYVAALGLEAGVVAAVVVAPETEKNGGDEATVDDRGGNEIHAGERVAERSWPDRASARTGWKTKTPRLPEGKARR